MGYEPQRPPAGPAVREREPIAEERYYPPPPEPPRTSSLAVASLATGIAAWIIFPIGGAIAAVVTGYLAQNEIRESNGRLTGSAFATAGLVLGWVQIGLAIIAAIVIGILIASVPASQAGLQGYL